MGKDHLGSDMRKVKDDAKEEIVIKALDEAEIALLKSYVIYFLSNKTSFGFDSI